MKTIVLSLALILSTGLLAQEKKIKVCIKIDENKNGTVSQVDTCYESTDHAEIEAFLKRMGMESHMNMEHGTGSGSKTIVIKHHDLPAGQAGEKDGEEDANFISTSPDNIIIEMDENGTVKTSPDGSTIIIKEFKGDEKELEKEIDALIKEAQSTKENEGHVVKKEIRIILTKKIEISQLSDEDRKTIPRSLKKVKGNSFEELTLFPNPTKDVVGISYKNNSSDVLKINLYDANGKLILSEEESNTSKEMNKRLDLSNLEKGIYFLHLEQGKKSEVKKLVVT